MRPFIYQSRINGSIIYSFLGKRGLIVYLAALKKGAIRAAHPYHVIYRELPPPPPEVVWDNCTQYEKNELDKIQNKAARIVTGTTKLVSIRALYEEVKWDTLEERRRKHKLALFYKMANGLSPPYLSSLTPLPRASSYNLRNTNNIQTIHARTNQQYNSFLLSKIRDWNNLTLDVRNSDSLYRFKRNLNNNDRFVPKYFYSGIRKLQILHTRLRTGCSSLNHDLFVKHITTRLFVFVEILKTLKRIDLNITISRYTQVTLQGILFGSSTLPINANKAIFKAVHKYIKESKRF